MTSMRRWSTTGDSASPSARTQEAATASPPATASSSTSVSCPATTAAPARRTSSSTMPTTWQRSGAPPAWRCTRRRTRNGGSTKAPLPTPTATSSASARPWRKAAEWPEGTVKTIGLLGGMSWESSIVYEQIINTEVRRRLGGVHSADLLVRSFDFADIEQLQSAGEWTRAGQLLAEAARRLEHAGAEILVLCTNTMHRVYEDIASAVGFYSSTSSTRPSRRSLLRGLPLLVCWARDTRWRVTSTATVCSQRTASRSSSPTSRTAPLSTTSSSMSWCRARYGTSPERRTSASSSD
jgi:hypothetical protein